MPLDSDYSIALASTDPCYAVYGTSSVTSMPGNDYMIVMMAFLSGYDFRPYFDLRGIAYSTLAETKCWLTLPLVFLSQLIDYPPASIFGTGFKKVKIDGVSPWPQPAPVVEDKTQDATINKPELPVEFTEVSSI